MKLKRLLECPFCGGVAAVTQVPGIVHGVKGKWHVYCTEEDCDTAKKSVRKEEAIEAWNTRNNTDKYVELVESSKALDQLLHCVNELPPDLRRQIRETGFRKALAAIEEE